MARLVIGGTELSGSDTLIREHGVRLLLYNETFTATVTDHFTLQNQYMNFLFIAITKPNASLPTFLLIITKLHSSLSLSLSLARVQQETDLHTT
jgi:hypothetical protein